MTNSYDNMKPLSQEYRIEEIEHVLRRKKNMIEKIINKFEKERCRLAQHTLDPLAQTLYSFLIAISTLDQQPMSSSEKIYFDSLKDRIESQLNQLKETTLHLYPLSVEDLGVVGALISYYQFLKDIKKITIDILFQGNLSRYPRELEIQLFRFIQQLIKIIDQHTTTPRLAIFFSEIDEQIRIKFEGNTAAEFLRNIPEYQVLKEIMDSLIRIRFLESLENEFQIEVIIFR